MSAREQVCRTPLHDVHVASGARMVDFAGWRLPVRYTGVIEEHMNVRTRAGLFDVSHMGEIVLRGPGALDCLQFTTCNDVARLRIGRAHYNVLTTAEGTAVDDVLVYRLDDHEFLVVANAGNVDKDAAWLREHGARFECEIADESSRWAQLALQGPRALSILGPLCAEDVSGLRYYGFCRASVDGVEALVSRTGYTGEDGFEIYAPAARAEQLWRALIEAGEGRGLMPIGLGARDTLRLEARMALYGNDIDETTTVVEAGLGWVVKPAKGEFLGREVLAREKAEGPARCLVGFEMRGRAIPRHGYAVSRDGERCGQVTSGSFAPFLGKSLGLAYLPADRSETGTEFEVEIRGRREPAVVVPTPFYRRPE